MTTKAKANVCVYLILRDGDKTLLSLRQNTGYQDGYWGLVSGHSETNEAAREALCREAYEEAGIQIKPEDLEVVHVMHRKTERENIDIFMHTNTWQGEIRNREPEKCGGLAFFDKKTYPREMIGYIQTALENIEQRKAYDELGW